MQDLLAAERKRAAQLKNDLEEENGHPPLSLPSPRVGLPHAERRARSPPVGEDGKA